jgi:hypothetical protein
VGPNINLCDTANLEPLKETKKVNAVSWKRTVYLNVQLITHRSFNFSYPLFRP